MSHPMAHPLLDKVHNHEAKLKSLAVRLKAVADGPDIPLLSPVSDGTPVAKPVQDSRESMRRITKNISQRSIERSANRVLELDTVKTNYREYNKAKRGFRGLCCIMIYFMAVLMVFWAANHTQSCNNSYTRLADAITTLEGVQGKTSQEMWNSIKTDIIEGHIFKTRVSEPLSTYKFADFSYLVGDLAITFSFGKMVPGVNGFPSLRPFQQHMHEEAQNATRILSCAGKSATIKSNGGLNFFLKTLGYGFPSGFTLYIPPNVGSYKLQEFLDCFDKFVEGEEIFDVSLDFIVLDPTTNPADWAISATTVYGFLHSTYTVSPPWTSKGEILGAGVSGAHASTNVFTVPHENYNLKYHPWAVSFRIVVEILVMSLGLWCFARPQIYVACGMCHLKQGVANYQGTRESGCWASCWARCWASCRARWQKALGRAEEDTLMRLIEKVHAPETARPEGEQHNLSKAIQDRLPDYVHVARDRSGAAMNPWTVGFVFVLSTLYFILVVISIFLRSHIGSDDIKVRQIEGIIETLRMTHDLWHRFVYYSACRHSCRIVQILLALLLYKRICDHALFHPQVRNITQIFASTGSNFLTVLVAFIGTCCITGACASIFWGSWKPAVSGIGAASWLVFKSEFKVASLSGNIPWWTQLVFNMLVDVLLLKILTGMVVDSYKKLASSVRPEHQTGLITDACKWCKMEITDWYGQWRKWCKWCKWRDHGYLHPLQMAVAAHVHRTMKSKETSETKDSLSGFQAAEMTLDKSTDHGYIIGATNVVRALNRVYCLAELGVEMIDAKVTKDDIERNFVEMYTRKYSQTVELQLTEELTEKEKQDQIDAEEKEMRVFHSKAKQDLLAICIKLGINLANSKDSLLVRWMRLEPVFKPCVTVDATYATDHYGLTRTAAVNKLMENAKKQEIKRREDKEKKAKEIFTEDEEKHLRLQALNKLSGTEEDKIECFEEMRDTMIKEGNKLFSSFDTDCVGLMDNRFTPFWVMAMSTYGLNPSLNDSDFQTYRETDMYFWEWPELQKFLSDPKHHHGRTHHMHKG